MDGNAEDKVIGVGFRSDKGYTHQIGESVKLIQENEQAVHFSSEDLTPFEAMLLGRVSLICHPDYGQIEVTRQKLSDIQPEYASVAFVTVSLTEKKASLEEVREKRTHAHEGKEALKRGYFYLFEPKNQHFANLIQQGTLITLLPGDLNEEGSIQNIRIVFINAHGETLSFSDEELSSLTFRKEFQRFIDWKKEKNNIKRYKDQSIELVVRVLKNAEVISKEVH